MRLLPVFFVLLLAFSFSCSLNKATSATFKIRIKKSFVVSQKGDNAEFELKIPIISNRKTQKIIYEELYFMVGNEKKKPEIALDSYKNRYAVIKFKNNLPKSFYFIHYVVLKTNSINESDFNSFSLIDCESTKPNKEIIAQSTFLCEKTNLDCIKKTFLFVNKHVSYSPNGKEDAITTFNEKKGICEGKTNLLISLLSLKGFRASYFGGFAFNGKKFERHAWAVVEDIPTDVTFFQISKLDASHIILYFAPCKESVGLLITTKNASVDLNEDVFEITTLEKRCKADGDVYLEKKQYNLKDNLLIKLHFSFKDRKFLPVYFFSAENYGFIPLKKQDVVLLEKGDADYNLFILNKSNFSENVKVKLPLMVSTTFVDKNFVVFLESDVNSAIEKGISVVSSEIIKDGEKVVLMVKVFNNDENSKLIRVLINGEESERIISPQELALLKISIPFEEANIQVYDGNTIIFSKFIEKPKLENVKPVEKKFFEKHEIEEKKEKSFKLYFIFILLVLSLIGWFYFSKSRRVSKRKV